MLLVKNIEIRFGDYPLKKPLAIASGVIRNVPQMFVVVEVSDGAKTVKGFGHNSISAVWADRRDLPLRERERQIKECVERARRGLRGFAFSTPFDFYTKFALKNRTQLPNLAYVMALSPIDLALWDAYAKLKGKSIFALPEVKSRMDHDRPRTVRVMHLVGMGDPVHSIVRAIEKEGIAHFKIKLGGRPDADAKRVNRIAEIKGVEKVTVDANEAYGSPGDLSNFIGLLGSRALRKLLLIEEPFARNSRTRVNDIGARVPVFADESCADHRDIKKLYAQGYAGVALKPHTKTFSGTLLCLDELRKRRMRRTIMDLTTAPPIGYLVGVACGSRLTTIGGTELNGRQYYKNWKRLIRSFRASEPVGWGVSEALFKKYRTAARGY